MKTGAYLLAVLGNGASDQLLTVASGVNLQRDLTRAVLATRKVGNSHVSNLYTLLALAKRGGGLTHPLKLVMDVVNEPEASAATDLEVSMAAKSALPQGCAALGRWTSLRTGVPATPRAGAMAAWADTCTAENATTRAEERRDL